jgi:hypothetical protein
MLETKLNVNKEIQQDLEINRIIYITFINNLKENEKYKKVIY